MFVSFFVLVAMGVGVGRWVSMAVTVLMFMLMFVFMLMFMLVFMTDVGVVLLRVRVRVAAPTGRLIPRRAALCFEMNIELRPGDMSALLARGAQVEFVQAQLVQLLLELRKIHPQIQQGADEHVAAHAAEEIQIEGFHEARFRRRRAGKRGEGPAVPLVRADGAPPALAGCPRAARAFIWLAA